MGPLREPAGAQNRRRGALPCGGSYSGKSDAGNAGGLGSLGDGSGDGIYARRYDAAGNALGDEFRVNEASSSEQRSPDIAATGDGGFVITWRDHGGDDIYAQKFDAAGARVDGQVQISSPATYSDDAPVVTGLAGNAFVVAWHAYSDVSSSGIFQRVVGEPQAFAHGVAPQIVDLATRVSFQENALNAAPQLIDAGIGLLDGDSANFAGGRLDVSFLTTYGDPNQYGVPGLQAQDQLGIRHQGMAAGQIGVVGSTVYFGGTAIGTITGNGANGSSLVVSFNAEATPNAVEHLIENLTYQNFLSNPEPSRTVSLRLADGGGGVTAPLSITLDIVANPDGAVMYGAEQVVSRVAAGGNQAGNQVEPAIATLAGGGYVVAYTDTSGPGVRRRSPVPASWCGAWTTGPRCPRPLAGAGAPSTALPPCCVASPC